MDDMAIVAIVFGGLFIFTFFGAAFIVWKDESHFKRALEVTGHHSSSILNGGKRVISKMSLPLMVQQQGKRRDYELPSYYMDK